MPRHQNSGPPLKDVCRVVIPDSAGNILLVQEQEEGTWTFPGGHRKKGEEPERAAAREGLEEIGYLVRILGLLDKREIGRYRLLAYLGEITGGELRWPDDEIRNADWFSLDNIRAMNGELRDPDFVISNAEAALRHEPSIRR